ncbi:hypothetical protein LJK88_19365 [Paenibacillus sp. P26]|nr:hypothetical protein LJK88_19365 [Paenibacillus sp. P26]
MNRRYPWIRLTFVLGTAYFCLYFLSYMFAGISYMILTGIPADQSRELSSFYYGVVFVLIPYFGLGFLIPEAGSRLRFTLHAWIIAMLAEKGFIVMLATFVASGFPASWYGTAFPEAGFRVLCEEFPLLLRALCEYVFMDQRRGWISVPLRFRHGLPQ